MPLVEALCICALGYAKSIALGATQGQLGKKPNSLNKKIRLPAKFLEQKRVKFGKK